MTNEPLFKELVSYIGTRSQANDFISNADRVISLLYQDGGSFEEKVGGLLSSDIKNTLIKILEQKGTALTDYKGIEAVLEELKVAIKKLNVVTVAVSIDLPDSSVRKIVAWFRSNVSDMLIADIVVDRTIVGGAFITYKGLFREYSVRKVLEEKFKKKELRGLLK